MKKKWKKFSLLTTKEFAKENELPVSEENSEKQPWRAGAISGLEREEFRLFSRAFPAMAGILAAVMILFLLSAVLRLPAFGSAYTPPAQSETIRRYIEKGLSETGAVNVVAGVILDYRAFDTLGESHVLFAAAAAVFILLLYSRNVRERTDISPQVFGEKPKSGRLRRIAYLLLFAAVLLFGIYGPGYDPAVFIYREF